MISMPILYSFRRCPFAMRARMALYISGIELEHREILLRDKPEEMLAASPKATVPVLILPDGEVLEESLEIMRRALTQNDPENWLDGLDEGLITANDGPFKALLDKYKYPNRHQISDATIPRDKAMEHLQQLNERLKQQSFLTGDRRAFTDIALFPFLRQFAATDQDWFDRQPFSALQVWLKTLVNSPLFEAIMVKHPLWKTN